MEECKKTHNPLMREGFAVVKDDGILPKRIAAIFDNYVDAHNYCCRVVGANNGTILQLKEVQGKVDE